MAIDIAKLKSYRRPPGVPFDITKLGHVVLNCRDLDASVQFYTQVLGLEVSDVYPETMVPGGMVFMRFNADHHGVALVGSMDAPSPNVELNHLAFEVDSLDEVVRARNHLKRSGVFIDFEGRRRAGSQIAVEFRDPDGHRLEIYWGVDIVHKEEDIRPDSHWKLEFSLEDAIAHPVPGQDTTLKDPGVLHEKVEAAPIQTTGGKSRWSPV